MKASRPRPSAAAAAAAAALLAALRRDAALGFVAPLAPRPALPRAAGAFAAPPAGAGDDGSYFQTTSWTASWGAPRAARATSRR